ncbi:hypothetical protein H311_00629 [Anncaliia algerae PRA109]|nr:hypothetical protein H311_00629 [Anncaliia algerae PRA109]
MPKPNFENNILGGQGFIVQIDETMLNFKSKSHRGRAANTQQTLYASSKLRTGSRQPLLLLFLIKK